MKLELIKKKINSEWLFIFSTWAGQGFRYYKFYSYHIFFLLTFQQFVLRIKDKKINFSTHYFLIAFWPLITLFWTPSFKLGVLEVIQIWLGIYFIIFNPDPSKLKSGLITAIYINLLLSMGESLELFRLLPSQYTGDFPSGLHWNHNNNAFFILFTAPIVLEHLNGFKKAIYLILSTFVIIKVTSKIITIVWICLCFAILFINLKNIRRFKVLVGLIFLTLGSLILLNHENFLDQKRVGKYSRTIPTLINFTEHIPLIFKKRFKKEDIYFDFHNLDPSLHERLTMLDGTLKVVRENFWFGIGAGGLGVLKHKQGWKEMSLITPHFYFFEIWAKYGIFYVLEYFGLILFVLTKLYQKRRACFFALSLFIIFNPVMATVIYFLPKWALYRYSLNESGVNL